MRPEPTTSASRPRPDDLAPKSMGDVCSQERPTQSLWAGHLFWILLAVCVTFGFSVAYLLSSMASK